MLYRLEEWMTKTASAVAARVKEMLEDVEGHARVRMVLFFAQLLLIGAVMFLLNMHTPLMMDDYDYSFSWATGERISGLSDVLASQAAHYRLWGGRSVVHAIAQVFLSLDKALFNAANTLMYLLLLLEIYALARPKGRTWCWEILLLAHGVLFTAVPFFGTVFLWLTGACNYLWGTVLALLPLLIARSAREEGFFSRGWHGWLAVPVCFLAGWTNENTACGVFAAVFVLLAAEAVERRNVPAWRWGSLAAQAAGIAFMLLAPGNYSRASAYESSNFVIELFKRAAAATVYGGVYVGLMLIGVILLWALCSAMGVNKRAGWTLLLLFGGLGAAYAMVASPVFSDRSWTGVIVLALCALLVLLGDLIGNVRVFDAAKLLALPLAALLIAYGGYKALGDVSAHEASWLSQVAKIQTAADADEECVVVDGVESVSRFTMDIAIGKDASIWPNSTLTRAYGVNVNGK